GIADRKGFRSNEKLRCRGYGELLLAGRGSSQIQPPSFLLLLMRLNQNAMHFQNCLLPARTRRSHFRFQKRPCRVFPFESVYACFPALQARANTYLSSFPLLGFPLQAFPAVMELLLMFLLFLLSL